MIRFARYLSFFMGFLSLSQEILWIRMAGFAYRGVPQAFGVVLAVYLLGIAVGAGSAKRFCHKGGDLLRVSAIILFIAGVFDFLAPWIAVNAFGSGRAIGTVALMGCVFFTAMFKSMIFPIAHHIGSTNTQGKVGSSVSKVYFANIVGSTLGPLVTGFVLLQYLTLQNNFALMAGITILVAACCWGKSQQRFGFMSVPAMALLAVLLAVLTPGVLMGKLVENTGNKEGPFTEAIENRYGIIHVLGAKSGGDYVFGGNAYDGRINTDFMANTNGISRVYVLAAVQPEPKRVLVIGMSAGPWTRVLTAFPKVELIDVVEINPGYAELARKYPQVSPILSDPRVHIHFDDGRRWLRRHADQKYDLIVMNNSYHFRAYSTLLLSAEFLGTVKQHLREGGVLAFNTTSSPDAYKTAATVFKNVYQFANFVVAGEQMTLPAQDEYIRRIAALRLDSKPLVNPDDPEVMLKLLTEMKQFSPYNEAVFTTRAGRPLEVITDQNMITEYRFGESVFGYLSKKRAHVTAGEPAQAPR